MDRLRNLARRLIRSLARKYVYEAATASGSSLYQSVLDIENSLSKKARKDWSDAVSRLDATQCKKLPDLIGESLVEAIADVKRSLGLLYAGVFLEEFILKFRINDLLPEELQSTAPPPCA